MESLRSDTADSHLHGTVFNLMKKHGVSGAAVCIVKSGSKGFKLTRTYGYANADEGKTVDATQSWFDCGSCAHLVCAMTTLRLLEEHNIPLTSDVNRHLPPTIKIQTQGFGTVTLHHLLCQTSGLVASTSGKGIPHDRPSPSGTSHPTGLPPRPPLKQQQQQGPSGEDAVMQYLSQVSEIQCRSPPGRTYSPSELNVWLLAAVAEVLGGDGRSYRQLAHDLVLTPLGIALGRRTPLGEGTAANVGPGTTTASPAAAAAALGQSSGDGDDPLTPIGGLVLTAQGAARLLEALVPASTSTANAPAPTPSSAAAFPSLGSVPLSPRRGGAIKPPSNDTPASQQKSGVSSTGIIRQQDSVLSTATLQQMASVQFTDPSKDLPVGFVFSCPPLVTFASCFCIDGEGTTSPSANTCKASFAVMPNNGVGVCVLAFTSGIAPEATAGSSPFGHHVLGSFLERFRPLPQPPGLLRPWLLNVQPVRQEALVHLICFPPAGVSPTAFETWANSLPDYIRVRTVQLPGRGLRKGEANLCRISKISGNVAEAIASLTAPDVRLALWGHGFGALCAFETARILEGCHNRHLLHLFVSGCASPDSWPSNDQPDKRYTPWTISKDAARSLGLAPSAPRAPAPSRWRNRTSDSGGRRDEEGDAGRSSEGPEDPVTYAYELPDEKLLGLLSACARTPHGVKKDIESELQEHLHALRPDIEAEETYVYRLPHMRSSGAVESVLASIRSRSEAKDMASCHHLSCPVTVLRGDQDGTLSGSSGEAAGGGGGRPPELLQGWSKMTSGGGASVGFASLPGGHHYWEEDKGRHALLFKVAQVIGKQLTVHTSWLPAKLPGMARGRPPAITSSAGLPGSGNNTPRGAPR